MGQTNVDWRSVRAEAEELTAWKRFALLLASARREILQFKAQVQGLRLARAMEAFGRAASERAFNPDQPRVPAGNPDGGQWTSVVGGALGPSSDVDSDEADQESIEVAADGHHFVPRALFEKETLSPETRRVFEDAKTGRLRGGPHYFDGPRRIYNAAVTERYSEFLRERGLRSEDLTPAHARQFADSIRNSTDPRIRDFNLFLYRREAWYWIRRLRLRE